MLNLPKGDRRSVTFGRRVGGSGGFARPDEHEGARAIIGGAHLVFGAVGLAGACVGLLFNASTPLLIAVLIVRVGFELATCYSGLLIKDGQRRGAFFAIASGLVRVVLSVLVGAWGLTLGISVVLIGAVVWLLPMLSRPEPKHTPA